jgi:hypothetical protein
MTPTELIQFTTLCSRVLAAEDHSTFMDHVRELKIFLDSTLPPEESNSQLDAAINTRLTFIVKKAVPRFPRS